MRKNGVLALNFGFFDFGKNPDLTSNLTLISNFQILGIDARQNFTLNRTTEFINQFY
jgi:hypothetical protein